jgi:hypothetical protein
MPFDTWPTDWVAWPTDANTVQVSGSSGMTWSNAPIPGWVNQSFGVRAGRTQPNGQTAAGFAYAYLGDSELVWTEDRGATWGIYSYVGVEGMALDFQEANEMAVYKTVMGFRDVKGKLGYTTFWTNAISLAAARLIADTTAAAFAALSYANQETVNGASKVQVVNIQRGANNPYKNIEDQVELVFSDDRGGFHRYRLGAAKSTLFQADTVTVDPTNAGILALRAAIENTGICGKGGINLMTFIGGRRVRAKTKRAFNTVTLDPLLTGQA